MTPADTHVYKSLLTDAELETFLSFASAVAADEPNSTFPFHGSAKRADVEKACSERFDFLAPAFKAIQRAGLVVLAPQTFSGAPRFQFSISRAGGIIIQEALGDDR